MTTLRLPLWAEALYPTQAETIQEVISAFQSGSSIVQLDAPTGSGKTLIADMVRQTLDARTVYLCNSIALQTQFVKDFPHAALLKGRSNYPTFDGPGRFPELTTADCTKERTVLPACSNCTDDDSDAMHCRWCHPVRSCHYETAKREAIRNPLVCTNTAYFLYESNYVGFLPVNRQLVVVDEADTLEDILLSFVQVHITAKQIKEYQLEPPERKTVEATWGPWAEKAESIISSIRIMGDSISAIRKRNSVQRLLGDIRRLNDPETGLRSGGWVYTGYDRGSIIFKPIRVDRYANEALWRHCKRWLLMSATTISFQVQADTLGMEDTNATRPSTNGSNVHFGSNLLPVR